MACSGPPSADTSCSAESRAGRLGVAGGGEDDVLAVRGPALDDVGAGVEGEALWVAAFYREGVDVDVAGVLGAEGHGPAVGGELGVLGLALEGGEAAGVSARAVDDPDVAGVGEGDVPARDGRAAEHAGLGGGGAGGNGQGQGGEGKALHIDSRGLFYRRQTITPEALGG